MERRTPGEARIVQMLNALYLLQLAHLAVITGAPAEQVNDMIAKSQAQAAAVQGVPFETS